MDPCSKKNAKMSRVDKWLNISCLSIFCFCKAFLSLSNHGLYYGYVTNLTADMSLTFNGYVGYLSVKGQ